MELAGAEGLGGVTPEEVEIMTRAIAAMGFATELEIIQTDLATPEAVKAVAECDVVFGCMDGVEGRHLLNRLAAFYVLPYFDVGVRLEADGQGGIDDACGAVQYLRPHGSTLQDRKVYGCRAATFTDASYDRVTCSTIWLGDHLPGAHGASHARSDEMAFAMS